MDEDQIIDIITIKPVTVLEFLIGLRPALPMSKEKPCSETSNSEIRRWCRDQSVVLNGRKVKSDDVVDFPVTSLVLFPKGRSRTTLF